MNDSDLLLFYSNNHEENYLPQKRSRTVAKTALLRLQCFNLPLVSSATDSPLHSLSLQPDRPYTIGRTSRNCDFTFNSRLVSKQHCQILFDSIERKIYILDGTFLLSDFSCVVNEFRSRRLHNCNELLEEKEEIGGFSRVRVSLNGVFVNGVRVRKGMVRELSAGDEVLLVCGNEGFCRSGMRIGFVILGVVYKEEVVFRSNKAEFGTMTCSGYSQGSVSSGKRNKRVFALQTSDVGNLECDFSRFKCSDLIGRANFLLSQCKNILNSHGPISCTRRFAVSDSQMEGTYGCSTIPGFGNVPVGCDLEVNIVNPVPGQEQIPSDKMASVVQSAITFHDKEVEAIEPDHDQLDPCNHNDNLCHRENIEIVYENAIATNNSSKALLLNPGGTDNALQFDITSKKSGNTRLPPGKKFYLNCLEFMDYTSSTCNVVSLPELLYPVESISQLFIATFTSDILWFLSYCEIPCHLPVTVACHNTGRCWSSSPDERTSVPYPDFPNLVVVFPPFPEAVAFGENRKKQGIACHHPKFFVLQREDSVRVIITSANLVAKQALIMESGVFAALMISASMISWTSIIIYWFNIYFVLYTHQLLGLLQWNNVTNTVWWQDFPRRSEPDYLSLFIQPPVEEINQDSRSDFAAQLASFMASLVIDVPSQAHWIVDLTKYDFGGATGHLIASVPGIYSCRTPTVPEFTYFKPVNHTASVSSGVEFLGSVEASVVGLSHLFHNAADPYGVQIKKLASFLDKSCANAYGMLEIVLRRNTNVPADVNAVSVLVPNIEESSEGDCVQLGFLPRNIAKWVSPLWDVGFIKFSGFVSSDNVLSAALGGINKKVQLILHVSQAWYFCHLFSIFSWKHNGPHFSDISKMMQPQHVVALSYLIASIQRRRGMWRLQEVLGQYRWPDVQESDFIYGSSSVGSINAQFLAAFAAAAGKKSLRFFDSEESDPEWGCWSASQELKRPSIRILFPTIERVKNACDGILPSKRILCFSEKTWQRLEALNILHDAIPYPYDRVGHPMHVKVARRCFQSRIGASSFGWVYCGSHNFSAAAWGRHISSPSGTKANGPEKTNSSSNFRLHICNYELGIIFVFPPTETRDSSNLDDVVLPFVVPAPRYRPADRPATGKAMKDALAELTEEQRSKLAELAAAEEMIEEIPDEEEEVEATDYVVEEKEEERAYAEMLWSKVDSS
ncbi:hypothetical protein Pint_01320 [Pistacia integerrima]|uniref:Uncharacterized protein n=1 Tax=Pistacia integerrima TaxID=434235 RepID=A0ACC0ZJA4_9ROSI|nr:hypothetical protein Pint_01320 [Pistacia integerrima]